MKILLVNPHSPAWTSPQLMPLGLGYLAAVLAREGFSVEIYDFQVAKTPFETVLSGQYNIVGISASTPQIEYAWKAAQSAKEKGAWVVLGGHHVSYLPAESLSKDCVDFVIRLEGEETLLELCRYLRDKDRKLRNIKGLSFKEGAAIVHNENQPYIQNLDKLPFPAHHLFDIESYSNLQPLTDGVKGKSRSFTILTSRGCPYSCAFCSQNIYKHSWIGRTADNVVSEWEYLIHNQKASEIGIIDANFNFNLERVKEICRQLIARGLNKIPWVTIEGMRSKQCDQELFELMKGAGCLRVGFGVESGNQAILDRMNKNQTLVEVEQAFGLAKKAGLQTMGFFMLGYPGETPKTMEDTIKFALKLDPDLANFMFVSPLPGTKLYEEVRDKGKLLFEDWREFAIHSPSPRFEYPGLPKELVERMWRRAYKRFYLNPARLLKTASKPSTWRLTSLKAYAKAARRFLFPS